MNNDSQFTDEENQILSDIESWNYKDIDNLDHDIVKNADILFVDVQGVGVSLGFKDEGLGLVEALKEKYPHKKVIIYSVVSQGDRFHNAFNVCDGQLSKDADPYQFQRVLEKFAFRGVNNAWYILCFIWWQS